MIAGRISFIGAMDVASYPHTETIVVVEGELTLAEPGADPLVIGPRAGVVIGCGSPLHIQAGFRARFVFCAAPCEIQNRRGLAFPECRWSPRAHSNSGRAWSHACALQQQRLLDDVAQSGAGPLDSRHQHRIARSDGANEFIHLLASELPLEKPEGRVVSVAIGDALLLPPLARIGAQNIDRVVTFHVHRGIPA